LIFTYNKLSNTFTFDIDPEDYEEPAVYFDDTRVQGLIQL